MLYAGDQVQKAAAISKHARISNSLIHLREEVDKLVEFCDRIDSCGVHKKVECTAAPQAGTLAEILERSPSAIDEQAARIQEVINKMHEKLF